MAGVQISASVGKEATNRPDDVGTVQTLLKSHGETKVAVDKICGPRTIAAIIKFQGAFLKSPDGRVDPGGLTWKKLVGAPEVAGVIQLLQLPQVSGFGYYSYSPASRQFGTNAAISALQEIAFTFLPNLPAVQIGIGDISLSQGGPMDPHHSHQKGRDADIRPLRKDQGLQPVTIVDPQYDRELTRLMVASFLSHENVRQILFNDSAIHGVTPWPGHDNHLHVSMKK
jgi:hypothetical protein